MTEVHSFGQLPVIAHAWNKDQTRKMMIELEKEREKSCSFLELALSLGKNDVRIYQKQSGKWKLIHTLSEHLSRILAIDWAPNTNRIVTASAVSSFDG